MRSSLALLPVLLVLATVPAAANDWLSLRARAEYQAEFETARWFGNLDDAGVCAYVEQQRALMNQRYHAEYHRSMPRPAAVPGATPILSPPRP